MLPNFYWETQRGGLCRLHSLNAFMNSINGSKGYFSEQKFREMCNEFDKKHIKGYKGFNKLKMIKENKNIIDIFGFCGNRYMWTTMKNKEQTDLNIHHAPEQYLELEKYILDYVTP